MSTDPPTPVPGSPLSTSRHRKYRFSTLCSTVENPSQKDQYGSSSVPIYQTATFKGVDGQYDYTRSGNPTRSHLGEFIQITVSMLMLNSFGHRSLQNIISPKFLLLVMLSLCLLEWLLWTRSLES